MLSVTIASVCVPRKIMDYTVTCLEWTTSTNISYCVFILLKSLPPGALEKSSITDQISFLTPTSMSLRQRLSGILIITVCPFPRQGCFLSVLPVVSTCTGVSGQHPTEIRLRFADVFVSPSKVFSSLTMETGFLSTLPENGFYEDHTTLVMILCTLKQSFPYQLLLSQCWGPCDILHLTIHTETCSRKRHTEGKTPRYVKFWYPCRDWLGLRWSSEDPYTPGL